MGSGTNDLKGKKLEQIGPFGGQVIHTKLMGRGDRNLRTAHNWMTCNSKQSISVFFDNPLKPVPGGLRNFSEFLVQALFEIQND